MKTHDIAAIPGDGIGTEVIAAGIRVLESLAKRSRPHLATPERELPSRICTRAGGGASALPIDSGLPARRVSLRMRGA
jgi:isocitrate/isopropylmalate dehydrogenase